MAIIPNAVPEESLDEAEIFRRGGENYGDEDFALCKCPHCGRIYLIEYEVDTLYLDPAQLDRRVGINISVTVFRCEGCRGEFPQTGWISPKAPEVMQVTWGDLAGQTCSFAEEIA